MRVARDHRLVIGEVYVHDRETICQVTGRDSQVTAHVNLGVKTENAGCKRYKRSFMAAARAS